MYQLNRLPRVRTALKQLPDSIRREILSALADLPNNPYPAYAEQLRSPYENTWKIKIKGWRMFYRVNDKDKVVTILTIKRRDKNTYSRMLSFFL